MKKTMILLLGLLMASAMPGSGLKAQTNTLVSFRVKTLDRAAVTSAKVYAAPNVDDLYCIDALNVSTSYAGMAAELSTLTESIDMQYTPLPDGSTRLVQNLNSSTYDTAFVVVKDENNVYYVYGNIIDGAGGVFKACPLFTAVASDSTINPAHRVFNTAPVVCNDNTGIEYTTITRAADSVSAGGTITMLADITSSGGNATVSKPVTLNMANHTITGSLNVDNTEDSVIVKDGVISGAITGNSTATGAIRLSNLTVTTVYPHQHRMLITSGNYGSILNGNAQDVTIYGGKFNTKVDDNYTMAPRRALDKNTDADAATYAWVVVDGYKVTFVNYNARIGQPGYEDTTIVYNTPDNRIVPAMAGPSYVGADTVFGHYWIDTAFTTPWHFDRDVLTSDTTLYAKWDVYDPTTKVKITANHWFQNTKRTDYVKEDEITYVCNKVASVMDGSQYIVAYNLPGFTPLQSAMLVPCTNDTVVDFYYNRDTTVIVWDFNGGVQTASDIVVAYQDTIDTLPVARKTGHEEGSWFYNNSFDGVDSGDAVVTPLIIPANVDTILFIAQYVQKSYLIEWSSNDVDIRNSIRAGDTARVVYNGESFADTIYGTFKADDGNDQNVTVTYYKDDTLATPCKVGTYKVIASYPEDANYHFSNPIKFLVVDPYKARAGNVQGTFVKKYDGERSVLAFEREASLVDPAPFGTDDVKVIVDSVLYFDATVGTGKTVNAFFSSVLEGRDAANYVLINTFGTATDQGVIYPDFRVNDEYMDNDSIANLYVGINGFCAGDESEVSYYLNSNSGSTPNQYKMVFDDNAKAQGFQDIDWTSLDGFDAANLEGTLNIEVPEDAEHGIYHAWISFRNDAFIGYPDAESTPRSVTFGVKLSKQYTRPLFEDVIALVDTSNNIDLSTIQWYRNGQLIDGATAPYYQQVGGFDENDIFYVSFRFIDEDDTVFTCPQDSLDMDNKPDEPGTASTTVSAYPNPAVDYVTVKVENATQFNHSVRVMNIMGATVYEGTFNGDRTTLDFSNFVNGSYTVSVDGIVLRVIKK